MGQKDKGRKEKKKPKKEKEKKAPQGTKVIPEQKGGQLPRQGP
jgi:hypothetical protein